MTIKIANCLMQFLFFRFFEIKVDNYRGLWIVYWIIPFTHKAVGQMRYKCLAKKYVQSSPATARATAGINDNFNSSSVRKLDLGTTEQVGVYEQFTTTIAS